MGWVLAGIGAPVLVTGVVFGVLAIAKNDDSQACNHTCGTDRAFPTANRDAWIADFAIPIGAVATAAGVYFVLTGNSSRGSSVAIGPSRIAWSGAW